MDNPLDSLQPYFSCVDELDEEKLDELHSIFQSDFMDNSLEIDGKKLVIKRHIYNPRKDKLPKHFARYFEKFVHIVTRENSKTKKREFRPERANRIHWIKPILEHRHDPRITHFKFRESNGEIRDYFWYKAKSYMVILQEVLPDYFLITGFCIDEKNEGYFKNKEAKRL